MNDQEPADERRPHRDWAQHLWLPLLVGGITVLVIALMIGLINARTASRWFGAPATARDAAVLGGIDADGTAVMNLRDLRAFLTIDAWLPSFAFLGLSLVLASAGAAIGTLLTAMREESRATQETFGHTALAPERSGAKLLPALVIAGLATLATGFGLAVARASFLSDFYRDSLAERLAPAIPGRQALLGSAEALGAWIPVLHVLGITLIVAGLVFGLRSVVDLHRFNAWRLRDMVSEESREEPGELYVVTRAI